MTLSGCWLTCTGLRERPTNLERPQLRGLNVREMKSDFVPSFAVRLEVTLGKERMTAGHRGEGDFVAAKNANATDEDAMRAGWISPGTRK